MKIGRVISIADDSRPLSWSGISFDVPAPLLCITERWEVGREVGADET